MLVYIPLHNVSKFVRKRLLRIVLGGILPPNWRGMKSVNATRADVAHFNGRSIPERRIKYVVRLKKRKD